MLPDGTYTAVVDRIEDELATLEVDTGDGLDGLTVEERALPADARAADAVVRLTVEDGALVGVEHDAAETNERVDDAQRRFDRLSRRPPREDEER